MQKTKRHGLVGDLWPLIQMMKLSGMWIFKYYEDTGKTLNAFRLSYAMAVTIFILSQFGFLLTYLILDCEGGAQIASATITCLFFTQNIVKYLYFAVRKSSFYRLIGSWNQINTHPMFVESNARHEARALYRIRKLIVLIAAGTLCTSVAWTFITFVDDSVRPRFNSQTNSTEFIEVPRLMLDSHYLWGPSEGTAYVLTFIYQLTWITLTLAHANIVDTIFCCFVIFTCEQLKHLKEIIRPLMELSMNLDKATSDNQPFNMFRVNNSNSPVSLQGRPNISVEVVENNN